MSTKPSIPRSALTLKKDKPKPANRASSFQQFQREAAWVSQQLRRVNQVEKLPGATEISLLAASLLGGSVEKDDDAAIQRAIELWHLTNSELKKRKTRPEGIEIENGLKDLGVFSRAAPWPEKANGTPFESRNLNPFLQLLIPIKNLQQRQAYYLEFLEDNPGGKKRTKKAAENLLRKHKGKSFTINDYNDLRDVMIKWWMQHESFNPLKFPKGSVGDIWKNLLLPEKEDDSTD